MTNPLLTQLSLRRAASVMLALVASTGCGWLDKPGSPTLSGPSEFGQSVSLTATPDQLNQDGQSQAAITAIVRGPNGEAKAGVLVQFDARFRVTAANDANALPANVTLTGSTAVTDAAGRATVAVVAPAVPTFQPTGTLSIDVSATPIGSDQSVAIPRVVSILLRPPTGLPSFNSLPLADFSFSPSAPTPLQAVTFDASASTDEGAACNTACTYTWSFGDGSTGTGLVVNHSFQAPNSYIVTLTVTDARGAVSVPKSKGVTVGQPTAPTADIVASPSAPLVNDTVNFDATGSTVGLGARITQYSWVFGDGSVADTTTPLTNHAYALAGSYTARVTVTDSLGRTATKVATVVVK